MPTPIALPSCLMDCCKVLFPKLDFSRIAFYLGLPPGASAADGFTMSSGGPSPDIRIYLKTYEPCSKNTFLVIAHELVHAVQIQGMTGGGHIPGSWATYYMSHYLGCGGRGADCDNALEKEGMTSQTAAVTEMESCGRLSKRSSWTPYPVNANYPGPHPTPSAGKPMLMCCEPIPIWS